MLEILFKTGLTSPKAIERAVGDFQEHGVFPKGVEVTAVVRPGSDKNRFEVTHVFRDANSGQIEAAPPEIYTRRRIKNK